MRGFRLSSTAALMAMGFALLGTLPAWSAVTFTNFGAGDTYAVNGNFLLDSGQYLAKNFTATATGNLTSVRLAIHKSNSITNSIVISLRAPGAVPNGTILESWALTPAEVVDGINVLTSVAHPSLTAGTAYWLRLETTSNVTYGWSMNSTGNTGLLTSSDGGVSWLTFPNDVSPVLEVSVAAQPPTISKSFSNYAITVGGTSTVTLNVSNPNATPLTNINITDVLPAGLVVASPPAVTNTCGGTVVNNTTLLALAAGDTGFALPGITLAGTTSCSFTVNVTSSLASTYNNTASASYTAGAESGTANSNTASLIVSTLLPLVVTKSFATPTVVVGGTVFMSLSITNPNSVAVTGFVIDHPPAGLHFLVALPTTTGNACGVQSISANTYAMNANLQPGGSCSTTNIRVIADTIGLRTNTTDAPAIQLDNTFENGGFTHTLLGTPVSAQVLVTPPPPTISKSFSPNVIADTGVSQLTITMHNPNPTTMTAASFSDFLPVNIVGATPLNLTTVGCGPGTPASLVGASPKVVNLFDATIAANSDCVVTLNVTSSFAGIYDNKITVGNPRGTISGTEVASTTGAAATLTVVGAPAVFKEFLPTNTVLLDGIRQLKITVTNPNPSAVLTNVAVSDTFPAGIQIATPNGLLSAGCGAATITATAGTNLVTLSGATINPSPAFQCIIAVNVTGIQVGDWPNVTTAPTGHAVVNDFSFDLTGFPSPNVASATLHVTQPLPPTVSKVITADTLVLGGTTSMTLTLTNPNAGPLTGVALTDIFPAGLVPSNPGGTCTPAATIVGQTLSISGVTLAPDPAAGHQCTITATVTGTALGPWTNTTLAPTATGPATLTGVPSNSDSVTVVALGPAISKGFAPNSIPVGSTTVLTINVANPNPESMTGVTFTDAMPASLIIVTPSDVTSVGCGVNAVAAAGTSNVSLTGGSIAANGTCVIKVTVQATAPGLNGAPIVNTTSSVTGIVQTATLTGDPAVATLQVGASEVSFLVRYASNLVVGDSFVNMTNNGNFASLPGLPGGAQNGNLCANVFAYSPDEQLVSCCSCVVTPNGLNSLSVTNDLTSNTLTPIRPSAVVIKMVASAPSASGSCNAATITRNGAANFLAPGLEAWGTTLHQSAAASAFDSTETPFVKAKISDAELARMTQLCAFIQANGSGYGICKSCKVGGLGASTR